MTDFIPVLIAAILLFSVMMIAFGGFLTSTSTYQSAYNASKISYVDTVHLGSDFNISSGRGPKYAAYMTGIISSGLLSSVDKSSSFEADGTGSSGGRIDLVVTNTNLYGPFIIKVNGNVVYSNYSRVGSHTIHFPREYLEPENVVEFTAGSSGWRIWAPTVYIFRANVSVDYYGKVKRDFGFTLNYDQFESLKNADLVSNVTGYDGLGRPVYSVNNYEVYRGSAKVINMPLDIIRPGVNNVTVSSESDTVFTVSSLDAVLSY